MSRRTFLKFCSAMAGVLALPAAFGPRIATALEAARPLRLVWLHGQACGGNTAAFLRSSSPTASELLIRLLSVDYQEMLMAASGETATRALSGADGNGPGYLAVVEGSIPRGAAGMYCLVGGRPLIDVAREVTGGALATIALGSCAVDGGVAGARNGTSDAVGVSDLHPGSPLVNLPGCPVNVENLVATVVHYLTFQELPPMGSGRRPLFAYGGLIHNQCERRPHFEFGEFATEWGDAGAQQGWCLYKLGCKGPEAFGNCPTERFAESTSWPVGAGHGCIGCTMPAFWDTMLPAYRRLPSPLPFASTITVDQVGGALVGGVAALAGVHAMGSYARARLARRGAVAKRLPEEPSGTEEEPTPEMTAQPEAAEPTAATVQEPAAEGLPAAPVSDETAAEERAAEEEGATSADEGGEREAEPEPPDQVELPAAAPDEAESVAAEPDAPSSQAPVEVIAAEPVESEPETADAGDEEGVDS